SVERRSFEQLGCRAALLSKLTGQERCAPAVGEDDRAVADLLARQLRDLLAGRHDAVLDKLFNLLAHVRDRLAARGGSADSRPFATLATPGRRRLRTRLVASGLPRWRGCWAGSC